MVRKIFALIILSMLLFIFMFFSCGNKTKPFIKLTENPDGTVTWNGWLLTQNDIIYYNTYGERFYITPNVLTTEDNSLTVSVRNASGDPLEYGTHELIQVCLNNKWYTLPYELSQNETPLILEGMTRETKTKRTDYIVDLSLTGGLPAGEYRFIEKFFWERLKEESYSAARFWVINPGDEFPREAETTGTSRKEDIIFTVESSYPARKNITDSDTMLTMVIKNLSGKEYNSDNSISPTLTRKESGIWRDVLYSHANLGLIGGWITDRVVMFFENPLPAGKYKIRLPLSVFKTEPLIYLEYEFDVLSEKDAPPPAWDPNEMITSNYDAAEPNTGITMRIGNPTLTNENTMLEITLSAEEIYEYGEAYEINVLLDGEWYIVPFADATAFNLVGYTFDPSLNPKNIICNLNHSIGCIPPGKYRIIKEFTQSERNNDIYTVTSKEFAAAEFEFVD